MTAGHMAPNAASRPSTRWVLGVAGAVMCAIGLVLLFFIAKPLTRKMHGVQ